MKAFHLITLFLGALLVVSCTDDKQEPKPDPKTTVLLETRLFKDGSAIEIGDTVYFSDGTIFNLKLFKLYLTNVKLIKENNEEVLLKDVALVDVGNENTGGFEAQLPKGNYTGIKIGFGVDADQNNADPATFPDEHPLSSYNQMYWSMLKYRFAILEGRSNANGAFDLQNDVLNAYHPGTDPLYQVREFSFDVPVSGTAAYIIINIDLEDIFYANPPIDLQTEKSTHSEASDIHIAQKFMTNLANSAQVQVDIPLSL